MPSVRYEAELPAPPDAVFAYLADFGNDAMWRANVLEMKPLGSATDLGGIWSRQIEVRKVPGKIVTSEAVITKFEPGQQLAVQRATGAIRPHAIYRLAPSAAGTRVSFELQIALRGAAWFALPLVWLFLMFAVRPVLPKDFGRLAERLRS